MIEIINLEKKETCIEQTSLYMSMLQQEYNTALSNVGDINEHLSVLRGLAERCSHITEFGVRYGESTKAFLMSDAKLISYDIHQNDYVNNLFLLANKAGKNATFFEANVLDIDIEPTELLFIDTLHNYGQLKAELSKHASKVSKYIVFHDTHTFGVKDEIPSVAGGKQGLLPAIVEFLIDNKEWKFKTLLTNNNGLTILERDHNNKTLGNKFRNLVPNVVSLDSSEYRRKVLIDTFKKYEITNWKINQFKKYDSSCDIQCNIDVPDPRVVDHIKGVHTSHILNIYKWFTETNEKYGVFFEDDVCFETSQFWNFTLHEFIDNLPSDWGAVSLCGIYEGTYFDSRVRRRRPYDHGVQAYAMKREYVKKLLDDLLINEKNIRIRHPGKHIFSTENFILNETYGNVYTFPLFNHNIRLPSTVQTENNFDIPEQEHLDHLYNQFMNGELESIPGNPYNHLSSHKNIFLWWKHIGSKLELKDIFNFIAD